jgi:hypothetical protein
MQHIRGGHNTKHNCRMLPRSAATAEAHPTLEPQFEAYLQRRQAARQTARRRRRRRRDTPDQPDLLTEAGQSQASAEEHDT